MIKEFFSRPTFWSNLVSSSSSRAGDQSFGLFVEGSLDIRDHAPLAWCQECRCPRFPLMSMDNINFNAEYLGPRSLCPRFAIYDVLRYLTLIRWTLTKRTSSLETWSTHDIRISCRRIHISQASMRFIDFIFNDHVSQFLSNIAIFRTSKLQS